MPLGKAVIYPTCRRGYRLFLGVLTTLILSGGPTMAVDEVQVIYEINTVLMETTFRIEGNGSTGTAFILAKTEDIDPTKGPYVLVTAAHVLEEMKGDVAILHLRKPSEDKGWNRVLFPINIRKGETILWTKHPDADIAAMYLGLPAGTLSRQLGTPLLADDEMLQRFEIHPGDNLNCLGFPIGLESGEEGFPMLRSGRIASYPLWPTKERKTFLFDFEVFRGNSGGPVYFVDSNRFYKGGTKLGEKIQFLVGLVSEEVMLKEEIKEFYGKREQHYPLKLARVVHASLINETIALLP